MAYSSARHVRSSRKANSPGDLLGFGELLKTAMKQRGWTTGETARRVREQLGEGAKFTPSNISHYTSGRSLPRTRYLDALSIALGIEKKDLMAQENAPRKNGADHIVVDGTAADEIHPPEPTAEATRPALHIEDRGISAWLQVNQEVPWPVALKILQVLKGAE